MTGFESDVRFFVHLVTCFGAPIRTAIISILECKRDTSLLKISAYIGVRHVFLTRIQSVTIAYNYRKDCTEYIVVRSFVVRYPSMSLQRLKHDDDSCELFSSRSECENDTESNRNDARPRFVVYIIRAFSRTIGV